MIYVCKVCGYKYDESKEQLSFTELSDDWVCPVCGVKKNMFEAFPEVDNTKNAQTSESDSESTTSEVLAQTLSNWGVKWVFGMVGHSNLGVADAIRKQASSGDMNFIGIRHEGAAAFAVSAYGKLMYKPAACLTIAGPGATNLITGVYDAKLDSAPAIALTGQIPASELGYYAFQEIDLAKPFADAVCARVDLSATARVGDLTSEACRSAILNSAPVQIVLPDDIQTLKTTSQPASPDGRIFSSSASPSFTEMERAAELLKESHKPFVVIGAGCARAIDSVLSFVEEFDIPFATTYRAKGYLPDSHPLACGVIGRSGTSISALLSSDCDLIIGLGCGFSKHSEIPKNKKTLQIDINPRALGRLRKVECGLAGDVAETLPMLSSILRGKTNFENRRSAISTEWEAWRAEKSKRAAKSEVGAIAPADVCYALTKTIPENAIVSVDVGNVAYSFGRYFEVKNQRMLLSFYLGSIGVGLPSAMGAWCASQEYGSIVEGRPVVAVVGDGGLGQYLAEWSTISKYAMDIKCVVFNNSELAKISLEQRNAHFNVWETSLKNPSFAEFAKLCGTKSVQISDPAKMEEQLAFAMSEKGAVMIEIAVAP